MLNEDVFVFLVYMVCPEIPMILLVNRLARALVPENDQYNLSLSVRTSKEFHIHDREAWKAVISGTQAISSRSREYLVGTVQEQMPFKSRKICWGRWKKMVNAILAAKNARSRIFYDNLACRTFRHCVLSGKMYLMGGTSSSDLDEASGNLGWWLFFMTDDEKLKWPSENVDCGGADFIRILMHGFPPIYIKYSIMNRPYELIAKVSLFGSGRHVKYDEDDQTRGLGYLPTQKIQFSFLNKTKENLDRHRLRLAEYISTESRAYLSLLEYKRRFVESEIFRPGSELISSLLRNPCFSDHPKTQEDLWKLISGIDRPTDTDTRNMLKVAREYTYLECNVCSRGVKIKS